MRISPGRERNTGPVGAVSATWAARRMARGSAAGEATARLEQLGIRVARGHAPAHLDDVDLVVVSSAIAADNPEVLECLLITGQDAD